MRQSLPRSILATIPSSLSRTGRCSLNDAHPIPTLEVGRDEGRGNLLGIQPFMAATDYTSQETFQDKLSGYLEVAGGKGWLNGRTIVVWPEYLGTWLVITGDGRAVARARTLDAAMRRFALRHSVKLIRRLVSATEQDKVAAALFRIRAGHVANLYQAVFPGLAWTYGVTMVAGSTVLPSPQVRDGGVVAGEGPLYGTTAVFGPDGRAFPGIVRKAYPIDSELPFLTPASAVDLPVFDTHAGRLGVLICADSWYPTPYARLRARGAELIAVPSYITSNGAWDKPWQGYNGAPAPRDVDGGDVGRLTEGQAWHTYALPGRIAESGARAGINVFLAGSLWDLGADGNSMVVTVSGPPVEAQSGSAASLNLWL